MNIKITSKTLLIFLLVLVSASFASALSLVAEYEDGSTSKTIMPGQSTDYYVFSVADQGLNHMTVKGELFDLTTGQNAFIKTLFEETTYDLFFSEMYTINPSDYNNLPGDYKIKVTAEEWLNNGYHTSKVTYLDLEVFGNRPPQADFIYSPANPTTVTPVTFTSTSYDEDGYLVKQEWYVNGIKIGEGQTTTYTFTNAGTYSVMLKVTDNDAATDTETKNIVVTYVNTNQYPVADFTYVPTNPVVDELVTFTSTSYDPDGTITLEEWDLNNDGVFETTGHVVSRTFTQSGTYTITIKVTDNSNLQTQTTKTITVTKDLNTNVPPVADFVYSPVSPVVNEEVVFTSTSYDVDGVIVSQAWYINGDYAGNQETIFHIFTQPGTYSINLIVTDNNGATDSETKKIIVEDEINLNIPPVADFVYSPVSPVVNEEVVFTSTSYDVDGVIVSQAWSINGAEVGNELIMKHTFAQPGTYAVSLTVTDDDGATDTKTKKIIIKQGIISNVPPVADFVYSPVSPVVNEEVVFTSTSYDVDGVIVSQSWSINGVFQGSETNLNKIFGNVGVYLIRLVVTDDDGATDSKTKIVIVRKTGLNKNNPPVADFTFSPISPMQGEIATFESISTDSDGVIVLEEWFVDGMLVSINHVMNYAFEESRIYTVLLKVTDDDGATDSKSIRIRIAPDCRPNAVLKMPESVVVGTTVMMDGSQSTAGCNAVIIAYEWKIYERGVLVDTFVTTGPYQSYTFNSNAEYKIILTVYTNTNKFDSDEKLLFAGRPHNDITIGKEDDLFIDYFYVTGEGMPYGVIECGKQFIVTATVTNDRDEDIRNLKITFAIPELGFEIESHKFTLDSGDTETVNFEGYLDMMKGEVPPGEYIAMIGASDTDTVRNKYFPLIIR